MNLDLKDVISGFILLIFIYLILANPSGTTTVVQGIGGVITNTTATLQGRGSAGSSGLTSFTPTTGFGNSGATLA